MYVSGAVSENKHTPGYSRNEHDNETFGEQPAAHSPVSSKRDH
jgi:hypothetical protein